MYEAKFQPGSAQMTSRNATDPMVAFSASGNTEQDEEG
jgi:hypothetical protein